MADDVERSEQPTPRRRAQARKKGQIAISQEVFVVANLLAVSLTLLAIQDIPVREALKTIPRIWHPRIELDPAGAGELLRTAFSGAIAVLLPILGAAAVAALIAGLIQTRGNIASERIRSLSTAASSSAEMLSRWGPEAQSKRAGPATSSANPTMARRRLRFAPDAKSAFMLLLLGKGGKGTCGP